MVNSGSRPDGPKLLMSLRALKVSAGLKLRAVSCPGVHLSSRDDVCLSVSFMDQVHQSEALPAVFPLLFHQKMTFEKVFRDAADPGDIAVLLHYERIRIELVQLTPPDGDTLACFEEDARSFLFPAPRLVPPFSGGAREVLMTRAAYFPGIAPRLEFSTQTTIAECAADTEGAIYPVTPLRPSMRRPRRRSSSARTPGRQRGSNYVINSVRVAPEGESGHLPRSAWRGGPVPVPSAPPLLTAPTRPSSSLEELQERVRGLLTTPQALRRLACGATVAEVEDVLARRSVSPGPP